MKNAKYLFVDAGEESYIKRLQGEDIVCELDPECFDTYEEARVYARTLQAERSISYTQSSHWFAITTTEEEYFND